MLLAISLYTYNQKRGRELIDLKSRQQREEFRQEYFQSMHQKDEHSIIHKIKCLDFLELKTRLLYTNSVSASMA